MNKSVELIDYSEINQAIGEYANLEFKIFVNEKYSALVKNSKGEYALVSNNYELTHPVVGYDDICNDEDDDDYDLELEYEVLFDLENNENKKYRYTILLDSIMDSNKESVDFDNYFNKNVNVENINNFNEWYYKQ